MSFEGYSKSPEELQRYPSVDEIFLHFTSPREKEIAHERSRKYTGQMHFFILTLQAFNADFSVLRIPDVTKRLDDVTQGV